MLLKDSYILFESYLWLYAFTAYCVVTVLIVTAKVPLFLCWLIGVFKVAIALVTVTPIRVALVASVVLVSLDQHSLAVPAYTAVVAQKVVTKLLA